MTTQNGSTQRESGQNRDYPFFKTICTSI